MPTKQIRFLLPLLRWQSPVKDRYYTGGILSDRAVDVKRAGRWTHMRLLSEARGDAGRMQALINRCYSIALAATPMSWCCCRGDGLNCIGSDCTGSSV